MTVCCAHVAPSITRMIPCNDPLPYVAFACMTATMPDTTSTRCTDGAIAAFRLNIELYPDSANTYDSLGDALEGSGDKAGAIAMYQKTLEVAARQGDVGQNGNAKAHAQARLKELGAAS